MIQSLTLQHASVRRIVCALVVLFSPLLCNAQPASNRVKVEDIPELKLNQFVCRKLRGGETHTFKVNVLDDEYFHVTVQQQGVDVVLTAVSDDLAPIVVDRPN